MIRLPYRFSLLSDRETHRHKDFRDVLADAGIMQWRKIP